MGTQTLFAALTILAFFTGIPAATSARPECEEQFQGSIQPLHITAVAEELSQINFAKDEFETTVDYRTRISKDLLNAGFPEGDVLYLKKRINGSYAKYNADERLLEIRQSAIDGFGFRCSFLMFELDGPSRDELCYLSFGSIHMTLHHSSETKSSYRGQNAFGVSRSVEFRTSHQSGVLERASTGLFDTVWLGPDERNAGDDVAFAVQSDPSRARDIKNESYAIVTVVLKPPYFLTGFSLQRPTIDNPVDGRTSYEYLIGDLQCIALQAADGAVLGIRALK